MPNNGAERLREYKQRLRDDPVKYEEYLRKKRERRLVQEIRNERKKESSNVSTICTEREQGRVRKAWRKRQQKHRTLVKTQREIETFCRASTPPSTSSESDQIPENRHLDQKRTRSARTCNYRKILKLE